MRRRGCLLVLMFIVIFWAAIAIFAISAKASGESEASLSAFERIYLPPSDECLIYPSERMFSFGIQNIAGIDTDMIYSLPEETEPPEPEMLSLGEFKITYYCCEKYPHICGNGDGMTATGIPCRPGIIAVDPDVIPYGTIVMIDGVDYLAADCGGGVDGSHIDIAVETHEEALALGVTQKEVFVYVANE